MVKAFDPLAENGALYYYHSKPKMYGEWCFWTWFEVVVPTYRNVLPMLYSPLWKSWIPYWTVISLCKFSVILSNITTYCAILSNIGLFQPIKARRRSVCPTHLSFFPPHHQHDTLASTFQSPL